jgi:hypothetical protein
LQKKRDRDRRHEDGRMEEMMVGRGRRGEEMNRRRKERR